MLPPAGKPAPIINLMSDDVSAPLISGPYDGLNIWELYVDWATPQSSSLSLNIEKNSLLMAPFDLNFPCSKLGRNYIPQPGVQPEQYIDMLTKYLMYQFAYRNFFKVRVNGSLPFS